MPDQTAGEMFRPIIPKPDLDARVAAMGAELLDRYGGRAVTTVTMLSGAAIFTADLLGHMQGADVNMQFLKTASYSGTTRGEHVDVSAGILDPKSIAGHDVLLIDDILDSGHSLHVALALINAYEPRSVATCVLLKKIGTQIEPYPDDADYVGFEIDDLFVIGYGMDYDNRYRNLRYIAEFDQGIHDRLQERIRSA
ncbi:MAG: phosphoribosyltransferase family protein [Planctomycetota bacterium]